MTPTIIDESERMRVMVALGEAERHITNDQSSHRHRRTREAINVCQGIFGPGPKATHSVQDALERVKEALQLLQASQVNGNDSAEFAASVNTVAAANSLRVVQGLLESYLDDGSPAARLAS